MAKAKESEPKEAKEAPEGAPAVLLEVRLPTGEVWGQIMAPFKEFKTGSTGYYANGKIMDPKSGQRYQVGCNIILIGSKK
jgi:hypothetical protein